MIESMLDTEPHLSVHQPNVFLFFVFLPAYGSIDFVCVCVYCMKTFSLLNIFVPYLSDNTCTAPGHVWE